MLPDSHFPKVISAFEWPIPLPEVDPDADPLVSVRFNASWQKYVLAALQPLTLQATWKTEDADALWLAQKRAMLLLEMFTDVIPERPFWETDDEIDNETLPTSPWYEQISDWIIAGFLATTFTPGAAIVYTETIPRLRLAFRSGSAKAFVRVLVDDLEIWTGDTSGAPSGILEQVLDIDTFASANSLGSPPHVLKVIKDDSDTSKALEVIRGDIRPEVPLQFRQNTDCTLQMSDDGGATWADIFDANACAVTAAKDVIAEKIADGSLGAGGQQSGQGGGTPTQCYDYDIEIFGNNRWQAPVAVENGDIVTVTLAVGAWWDGDVLNPAWNCVNGQPFVLGTCAPSGDRLVGTDPAPTIKHMRLIGQYNGSTYVDAFDTTFTVASVTGQTDLFLLPNDSALTDNQGSVHAHVQICKGGWYSLLDFRTNNHGFASVTSSPLRGHWVSGQGWLADDGSGTSEVRINKTLSGAGAVALHFRLHYSAQDGCDAGGSFYWGAGGINFTGSFPAGTDLVHEEDCILTGTTYIRIDLAHTGSTHPITLHSFEVWGTGTKPTGLP